MSFNIKNAFIFSSLLLSSLFAMSMEQGMPLGLYNKLHVKQLEPRCAFLASVGENDHSAVKWMLENYPVPQGKNALDYFSIYPNGVTGNEYFTPMTVAWHKGHKYLAQSLLIPLIPVAHHVTSSTSTASLFDQIYNNWRSNNQQQALQLINALKGGPYFVTGYSGPIFLYQEHRQYPLYLAACSKNLASHSSEIRKLNALDPSAADNRTIRFLLLTIIMNNDTEGLELMKHHVFHNITEALNMQLGLTLFYLVGVGKYQSTFNSENEIRQFINYPILRDKKQILLNSLILYTSAEGLLNNVQIQKAKKVLEAAIFSEQHTKELFVFLAAIACIIKNLGL